MIKEADTCKSPKPPKLPCIIFEVYNIILLTTGTVLFSKSLECVHQAYLTLETR